MDTIESQDESVGGRDDAVRGDSRGATLHEIVSAQAAATPQETAVVFEGQSLSYQELEARSNQLAPVTLYTASPIRTAPRVGRRVYE